MKSTRLILALLLCMFLMLSTVAAAPQDDIKKPAIVMLPVIDKSGWPSKYSDEATKIINNRFDKGIGDGKMIILKGTDVQRAVQEANFDNADTPVLSELLTLGAKLQADYVVFFSIEPLKSEHGGFGIGVGTGTFTAKMNLKVKYVDVKSGKYIANKVVYGEGKSTSFNIGILGGGPSPKNAIGIASNKCMDQFFELVGMGNGAKP